MKKFNVRNLKSLSNMQIANRVFYVLIGIIALTFVLFRLVGFNNPYDENPDYNAPLLTGTLITLMLVLTAGTLALAVWSFIRQARMNSRENRIVNNIPAHRIAIGVVGGTAALLVITFAASSTDALTVNGKQFADAFWLRTSGMFIGSSLLMIVAAIGAVIFGATRNRRK